MGFGGFAEDIGVYKVGHDGLLERKIAGRGGVPFELPVFDRAIAEDIYEFFRWLESRIGLGGNHYGDGFVVPVGLTFEHPSGVL